MSDTIPSTDIQAMRKAAEQGHAEARFCLGECCEEGVGVEKDPVEAARWYRLAAEQGHEDAAEALARLESE